jgi:hypothetical protein
VLHLAADRIPMLNILRGSALHLKHPSSCHGINQPQFLKEFKIAEFQRAGWTPIREFEKTTVN